MQGDPEGKSTLKGRKTLKPGMAAERAAQESSGLEAEFAELDEELVAEDMADEGRHGPARARKTRIKEFELKGAPVELHIGHFLCQLPLFYRCRQAFMYKLAPKIKVRLFEPGDEVTRGETMSLFVMMKGEAEAFMMDEPVWELDRGGIHQHHQQGAWRQRGHAAALLHDLLRRRQR